MIRYAGMGEVGQGGEVGPERFVNPVVTVGVFDGVHLGHRQVLRETIDWAREAGGNSVVITFDRHPQALLRGKKPLFISSLEHRLVEFEAFGIDHAIVLKFDRDLAATPPETFLTETILGAVGSRRIVMGYNAAFGKGGAGTYSFLAPLADRYGYEVRQAQAVAVDGQTISSTAIRKEILAGHLETAARMLGRPISVLGSVIEGCGRGRRLGFPTANLDLHHELRPPTGVYITTVRIGARLFRSITNIGVRPTFASAYEADKGREVVETHILNFDEELYGQDIEVSFVEKVREEMKFNSKEELTAQIAEDLKALRARCGEG